MLTPFQIRAKQALENSVVLSALPDEELRWLRRASFRKGELLHEKGDPTDQVLAVVEGTVQAFSGNADRRSAVLYVLVPGDVIGDLSILSGAPHVASAQALSDCELAVLARRDLQPMLERHPALYAALGEVANETARRLAERIEDSVLLSVEDRIEKTLVDLAQRFGESVEEHALAVRLRQQDLADLLGLSRGCVNRVLTSPEMRGRVELRRGSILLLESGR